MPTSGIIERQAALYLLTLRISFLFLGRIGVVYDTRVRLREFIGPEIGFERPHDLHGSSFEMAFSSPTVAEAASVAGGRLFVASGPIGRSKCHDSSD
jgi:hypothetical protein